MVELIDHIVSAHHEYLRRQLPQITRLLAEVQAAQGGHFRELEAVWKPFVEEINGHLWKEEMILFPMVRAMAGGAPAASSHCGGLHNPIRVMLMEHDAAESALQAMRRASGDYRTGREQAATLYRALEELEADLREHIRKENDILFPRVIAME